MVNKIVHRSGKRKTAVARTTVKEGTGVVRINSIPLDRYATEIARLKVRDVMRVASDFVDFGKVDINVNSHGGGVMGQADAVASSIAKAMVDWSDNNELLEKYHSYDRTIIAGDYRQTEVHKPSQSSKGPRHKRQKSYR